MAGRVSCHAVLAVLVPVYDVAGRRAPGPCEDGSRPYPELGRRISSAAVAKKWPMAISELRFPHINQPEVRYVDQAGRRKRLALLLRRPMPEFRYRPAAEAAVARRRLLPSEASRP